MNIHRIIAETKSEGPGNRVAIWVQGCSIQCYGCMAKDTWDTKARQFMTPDDILSILDSCTNIEGVTILGGEPFDQAHELAILTQRIKKRNLSLIILTGYVYEHLLSVSDCDVKTVLDNVDVLIDGPYVESLRSFNRPLVGSDNQRFLFLTDKYKMSDFGKNTIEVRIDKDGIAQYNGMGDFVKIKRKTGVQV